MLSLIIAFWAWDEAQLPSQIGPHWLRVTVCAGLALDIIIRIWRGRREAA
jgi:hypothetical protein